MTKLSVGLEEAQEVTGLSQHLLRKMVVRGTLKAARVGRRILIPLSELERIVKPGAITPTSPLVSRRAQREIA